MLGCASAVGHPTAQVSSPSFAPVFASRILPLTVASVVCMWSFDAVVAVAVVVVLSVVVSVFVNGVLDDVGTRQIRRRAFKELLAHLIPLMLDCLKSPEGSGNTNGTALPDANASSIENALGALGHGGEIGGPADMRAGGGVDIAGKGLGGEVVVLHYYQQHHQYLLKVAVLETMSRWESGLVWRFRELGDSLLPSPVALDFISSPFIA